MAQIREGAGRTVSTHGIPNTFDSIVKFVSRSKALSKASQRHFNEVLISKRKPAKKYYFYVVFYNSIFLKRFDSLDTFLETVRTQKTKEVYKNLSTVLRKLARETSCGRQETFSCI